MRRQFWVSVGSMLAACLGVSGTSHAGLSSKLLASDGSAGDRFGYATALAGDHAVVGAPGDGANGELSGSAYVYVRVAGVWSLQAKLLPSDGSVQHSFGQQVAISGSTIVVGAPYSPSAGISSGAAYVFVRSGTVWTQQAKLAPADPHAFDYFGAAVAVEGNTAAIGAAYADPWGVDSGAAYVYVRSGSSWTQQAKIIPADGRTNDLFGSSIAIHQNTLAAGAPNDDDSAIGSGSAYVYLRTGTSWALERKLRPADGANGDLFGSALALETDTLLIGAPDRDEHGLASGGAYVFTRSGSFWSLQQKLIPIDGAAGDYFGAALALSGNAAVIGAFLDDEGAPDTGAAYLYQRSGSSWAQSEKLKAVDRAEDDNFGVSVGLWGGQLLVGVEQDDDRGADSGAVHLGTTTPPSAVPVSQPWPLGLLAFALLAVGGAQLRGRDGKFHRYQ